MLSVGASVFRLRTQGKPSTVYRFSVGLLSLVRFPFGCLLSNTVMYVCFVELPRASWWIQLCPLTLLLRSQSQLASEGSLLGLGSWSELIQLSVLCLLFSFCLTAFAGSFYFVFSSVCMGVGVVWRGGWVGGYFVFLFFYSQSALETDKVKCVTDGLPYFCSAS